MPFVALQMYEESPAEDKIGEDKIGEDKIGKESIFLVLVCCFCAWLVLTVMFFCHIDLSYAPTFFGMQTAPQLCVSSYKDTTEDSKKFWWVFGSRIAYSRSIHDDVKTWVANNIVRWREEKEEW